MKPEAMVHLLYGFVGAGKTAFARQLERESRAVRFTHDEWMARLYGQSPPPEKYEEYHARIAAIIWQIAERLLELGTDVILDFGFWSRASRDDARSRVEAIGAQAKLFYVTCPEPVMRQRVLERSEEPIPFDSMWINEHAFELFKSRFEPLGDDEEHVVISGNT